LLRTGAAAAGAFAAGASLAPLIARGPRRNVIFIIADAMRADSLGRMRQSDGNSASITPFLDSLKGEAVSFAGAVAPSSWTPVSMGSILYGASPPEIYYEGEDLVTGGIDEGLQHELAGMGYYTAAVVANEVLDLPRMQSGFARFKGYAEGAERRTARRFAGYPFAENKIHAARVNREAFRLITQLRSARSFFLYLHYMDTHEPYFAPEEYLRRFGWDRPRIFTGRMRNSHEGNLDPVRPGLSFDEGMRGLRISYDAAVRFVDDAVWHLLRVFSSHGLLDETLVIFTADHGEEFIDGEIEEERTFGHALNLSQPALRVPLVMWARNSALPRGLVVDGTVSLAQAVRSALRWFSAGADASGFDGVVAGLAPGRRGILSTLNFNDYNGASWIEGDTKVVVRFGDDGERLYRRAFRLGDRGTVTRTAVPSDLAEKLHRAVEEAGVRGFNADALDESIRRRLRAVGYLN